MLEPVGGGASAHPIPPRCVAGGPAPGEPRRNQSITGHQDGLLQDGLLRPGPRL